MMSKLREKPRCSWAITTTVSRFRFDRVRFVVLCVAILSFLLLYMPLLSPRRCAHLNMLLMGECSLVGASYPVDVLNWLSPTPHDNRHKEIKRHWIKGTGIWLLETPHYKRWRFESDAPSFLWCHGGQGTGKTVLTYSRLCL
jgi:hypothetical protein